jgi:cyclopropane-fatty-acyl-phospholipid synthase
MDPRTLERRDEIREHPDSNELAASSATDLEIAGDNGRRPSSAFERWLMNRLLVSLGRPPLTIQLWDGTEVAAANDGHNVCMRVHDRRSLYRLILDPPFHFAEGYSESRIDVEGDLIEFLSTIQRAATKRQRKSVRSRFLRRLIDGTRRNTLSGSRKNIHYHYDIGNDFYKLWLDEQLAYTCAYFSRPGQTLEEAQRNKMDHVCRKLWLRPGETVVEAGCGWGALALHMAKHYGVKVKAYNISTEQIAYARSRAESEELADRVEFIQDDWRNIRGQHDVFVSVGMLEHVGLANYRLLGDVIDRSLRPRGRGLIHSIGQNYPRPFDRWTERRIFPGAYPPAIRQMMTIFERNDFSVLDLENIRLHYAETIRHWWARYEQSVEKVRGMFDERFVRMWRLYLAASVVAFKVGNLQLFQVVFARGSDNDVPRTREYQYTDIDLKFGRNSESRTSGDGQWNAAT